MYSQMKKRVVSALVFTGDDVEVKNVEGYAFVGKGDKSTPVFQFGGADVVEVYETVSESDLVAVMSESTWELIRKSSKSRVLGALNRSGEDGYTVTGDWIDVVHKKLEKNVTREGVSESELAHWRNITKKVKTVSGWYYVMPYEFATKAERQYASVEQMQADK